VSVAVPSVGSLTEDGSARADFLGSVARGACCAALNRAGSRSRAGARALRRSANRSLFFIVTPPPPVPAVGNGRGRSHTQETGCDWLNAEAEPTHT